MLSLRHVLFAAVAAVSLLPLAASADTYTKWDFSGAISPGDYNVLSPFSGNGFTQSDPLSGSFVSDDQQVPGAATGLYNAYDFGFPDAIPGADAFTLHLDSLSLTGSDNIDAQLSLGTQYNNGAFHGFEFIGDFQFQSNYYQLRIDGTYVYVRALDGDTTAYGDVHGYPTGGNLISGYINGGLTNPTVYVPPVVISPTPGVPEPATWAMFLLGFGAIGLTLRAARRKPVTA